MQHEQHCVKYLGIMFTSYEIIGGNLEILVSIYVCNVFKCGSITYSYVVTSSLRV